MVLSLATVGKTLNPKLAGGDYGKQETNERDLKTVLELPRKKTNKTCANVLNSVRHDGEPRSHLPDLTNRSNRSVSQMVRDMSASRLSKRANDPQLVFDEINLMQQEIMRKSQIAEEKTNTLPLLGYGELDSQKQLDISGCYEKTPVQEILEQYKSGLYCEDVKTPNTKTGSKRRTNFPNPVSLEKVGEQFDSVEYLNDSDNEYRWGLEMKPQTMRSGRSRKSNII